MTSHDDRFDPVTIALHWSMALLVLVQFAAAWSIDQVAPAQIEALLAIHRSTGLVVWGLALVRLAWRASRMRIPPPGPTMTGWRGRAARLNEYALYGLLLAQPATGLADTLFRGHPFALFGWTVPALMTKHKAAAAAAHELHALGGWLLAALILLHALAALFHRVVLKDSVLASMLPWRAGAGPRGSPDAASGSKRLRRR
jgi:cytochrome b561